MKNRFSALLRFLLFPLAEGRRIYLREVAESHLFDRQFYLASNPGLNPLYRLCPERHFILFGEREGRHPNPDFSPGGYLRNNPDLAELDQPAFLHYLRRGRFERRVTRDLPPVRATRHVPVPVLRRAADAVPPRDFAVVAHVFYPELWPEIDSALRGLDLEFDLFVTVTAIDDESTALMTQIRKTWPGAVVAAMPNLGRDIFPFVHLVNSGLLDPYRAIAKVHTKRSPHRIDGDRWRQHLIRGILRGWGTRALLDRFLADAEAAFWVADGQLYEGREWWGSNREGAQHLLNRVEIACDPDALAFPAGSMYWLKPLMRDMIRGLRLDRHSFDPEHGQVDGTLAHAFERALGYFARHGGQKVRQTREFEANPSPPRPAPVRPAYTSAFYLPQFHPTPENDAWWGKGFTEWAAVTRARPAFAGHCQPVLPTDLGFYDLRLPEAMGRQWQMARAAGIDAFCVHHYWFDGRRVLQAPLDGLLAAPEVPFSFYLCWANESWRRNWDGLSGEVLLEQGYADGFEAALARDCLPYMRDPRYARPDGQRPRFVVYRPGDMPDPAANVTRLREAWRALGLGEVELGAVHFHRAGHAPVAPDLFDFWIEMPPHGLVAPQDYLFGGAQGDQMGGLVNPAHFRGVIYDYLSVIRNSLSRDHRAALPPHTIAGVMPGWDNTARRGAQAHLAHGANPAAFDRWLRELCAGPLRESYRCELFINAWNEWAEKAMLEPCEQYGRACLDVLRAHLKPGG
ncbi:glycoside hydrolase family 99-like domain-containing protein [Alkalilacustris brevis]|uniref:glycoside hydrolase family 99-like domain-containing protein n=1 Tax=Alkalilacustris brevis TaxID=2026338 RepID=UPI000E0D6557|nr:glycoside hydrolase family 99-like domain-containing protein [Alkalilacustris brevis]